LEPVERVIYEAVVCPECEGSGCRDGDPCPESPGLCFCEPCPHCGGAGAVRHAILLRIEPLRFAA